MCGVSGLLGESFEDFVDEVVLTGFFGGHEVIAVGVFFDFGECLSGVFEEDFVHALFDAEDFFGMDFEFCGGAFHAGEWLVDHDAGIGEGVSFAWGAGGEQDGAHAGGLSDAVGGDIAADVLHGVIDGHAGGDGAAWGIDVEVDISFGVIELEEEKLSDDAVGDVVVYLAAEDDDAILEEPAVDIHCPLIAAIFFDDIGDKDGHV
ncbi:MAG: hypothetical protein RL215_21 [Planctomycetota bacterium]